MSTLEKRARELAHEAKSECRRCGCEIDVADIVEVAVTLAREHERGLCTDAEATPMEEPQAKPETKADAANEANTTPPAPPPETKPVASVEQVEAALAHALALADCLPGSRFASLVKTRIEEAQLWLGRVAK